MQRISMYNIESIKIKTFPKSVTITIMDTYNNKTEVIAVGDNLKLLGGN